MYRSSDGVVELATVDISTPSFLPLTNDAVNAMRAHLAASGVLPAGLSAQVSGQAGIGRDYLQAIQDGTNRTTMVTILLVIVVLLLIYRAPLAALAPLLTIGAAFLVSRGVLGYLAQAGWESLVGPGFCSSLSWSSAWARTTRSSSSRASERSLAATAARMR